MNRTATWMGVVSMLFVITSQVLLGHLDRPLNAALVLLASTIAIIGAVRLWRGPRSTDLGDRGD